MDPQVFPQMFLSRSHNSSIPPTSSVIFYCNKLQKDILKKDFVKGKKNDYHYLYDFLLFVVQMVLLKQMKYVLF